ncbi:hypothetical protein IE991_31970 [Klebsiella pneumoniae]|uniref:Uncharacterized protein n=1 Tax=Klebsiella pneumoniae TaxID=573 RepID=A0A927HIE0_KLEPN|nr:hypothetical protein [Klebsiella pneumoniae]
MLMIVFQRYSAVAGGERSAVVQRRAPAGDWMKCLTRTSAVSDGYRAAHRTIHSWGNTISRIPTKFPPRPTNWQWDVLVTPGAADHARYRHRSTLGAFSRPGDALSMLTIRKVVSFGRHAMTAGIPAAWPTAGLSITG